MELAVRNLAKNVLIFPLNSSIFRIFTHSKRVHSKVKKCIKVGGLFGGHKAYRLLLAFIYGGLGNWFESLTLRKAKARLEGWVF